MITSFIIWLRKRRLARVHRTKWPSVEATIQSGQVEQVHGPSSKYTTPPHLPVLEFSYAVAGEYYGGRFAVSPYAADPEEPIIQRLIGKTVKVLYNPAKPEEWLIPDEMIGGWRVEQKPAPHLVEMYPEG